MSNDNKIKILQVVPSLSQANGVAAYISTYFQNMEKDNIEMTFLVLNNKDKGRYKEVSENGGKIVELFKEKNLFKYFKKIDRFFKNNNFDIVHCHTPNYGAIILRYAKKYNIKTRILHSHVNKSADKMTHKIRNDIITPVALYYANEYFACSNLAGKFLFKKREYKVINNAIDIDKYSFSEEKRSKLRKNMNISDNFVIGEFGRLCNQKNQLFTLDIFYEILKIRKDSILVLAGNGPLEDKIRKKIEEMNISDKVLLLGSRNDLDELYNCLDVFLLPSTYEGLGIVLIEAQANGLSCFASDFVVPKEAKVTPLLEFISLNEPPSEWAKIITQKTTSRENHNEKIAENGFNIKVEASNLLDEYKRMYKEKKEG